MTWVHNTKSTDNKGNNKQEGLRQTRRLSQQRKRKLQNEKAIFETGENITFANYASHKQ